MEYGVLTFDPAIEDLLGTSACKKSIGISEILSTVKEAIVWLKKDSDNTLIIAMPLDECQRGVVVCNLGSFDKQCIALDPHLLLSNSHSLFTKTEKISINILRQIRGITNHETIPV